MAFGYQVLGFGSGVVAVAAAAYFGGRGVCGGGQEPSHTDRLQYITIASLGNSTDFGNLVGGGSNLGAFSNGTRGVWMGGTN